MKKLLILVEGQTEERFVKDLLAPALPTLWLVPTVVNTKSTGARPHKGGSVAYQEWHKQLGRLLRDPSAGLVTMMFDFQGLGPDFPGRKTPQGASAAERVRFVEKSIAADVANQRFLPYLALHEFEALLFVDPSEIAAVVGERRLAAGLEAVRTQYHARPEDINDSPATSPSARIETLCEQLTGSKTLFGKAAHGAAIATRIGLGRIRAECPHFNEWVGQLEAFAAAP